jgi:hypothetical protein
VLPEERPEWLTPSVVALIAANLVPVYGVLFLGWDTFVIVFLFWLENVIVGLFNVLRIVCARPSDPVGCIGKLGAVPFFCFHYGMFCAVHGVFVFALFGGALREPRGLPTPGFVWDTVTSARLVVPFLALVASHGFSFLYNYIGKGEYRTANIGKLFGQPYARVVVLHVAILFGGFLTMALGSPVFGLFLLVVLKIGLDIGAHRLEHRKMGAQAGAAGGEAEPDPED